MALCLVLWFRPETMSGHAWVGTHERHQVGALKIHKGLTSFLHSLNDTVLYLLTG